MEPYDEENDKTSNFKQPLMWPLSGRFSNAYKYWMLPHSLFVAVFYVFRISFEGKPSWTVVGMDYYMDVVYLIDMIRIFRSPYVNENGKMVTSSRLIAMKYLKSWFFFDLYCFFPLAHIRKNSKREDGGFDDLKNLLTFNFERLPRFYKIMLCF